jgi:hypothetical protein
MVAIVVVGAVFVLIAIGFVWAGRSDADARARRVGYRAGSLTPPGPPPEEEPGEPPPG